VAAVRPAAKGTPGALGTVETHLGTPMKLSPREKNLSETESHRHLANSRCMGSVISHARASEKSDVQIPNGLA
jgi:hypothetical protein